MSTARLALGHVQLRAAVLAATELLKEAPLTLECAERAVALLLPHADAYTQKGLIETLERARKELQS